MKVDRKGNVKRVLKIKNRQAFAWIITWVAVAASFAFTVNQLHHYVHNANEFTVQQLHQYSDRNRQESTRNARIALTDNCRRGNGTRKVILRLLDTGKPQLRHALQQGRISKSEYEYQLKQLAKEKKLVTITNCEALFSGVH